MTPGLNLTRRDLLAATAVANVSLSGCSGLGLSLSQSSDWDGKRLTRLAMVPAGAEVTGLHLGRDDTLFLNVQHPSEFNDKPYNRSVVGAFEDPLTDLPREFPSVQVGEQQAEKPVSEWTSYQPFINGFAPTKQNRQGEVVERLGAPKFAGRNEWLTRARMPDMNVFVSDGGDPNAGWLFTNWESKPGMVSRMRIERESPGKQWKPQTGMNIDFRDVEGTIRNCFGTLSPWGTPLSSEEWKLQDTSIWNRSPSGTETVPEPTTTESGTETATATHTATEPETQTGTPSGEGKRPPHGAVQLARHLGHYPNPYRYGYIVEIQDPKASSPTPVKHFAMGRFAHENALVMPDERTVYLSDDAHGAGFFKFVADEPGDLSAGTLYAARATQNGGSDPSEVSFGLEWLELAHATNAEIEQWIAEYDDVDLGDYEEGSTSYISDAEVQAWANGEADDDRVAFLETRKAAEAIGATVEFNKMEGINARRGAEPGESIYVAMSGLQSKTADDEGDIRVDPNENGAVYRLPIEDGYEVSTMEPIIVGGTDGNVCGGCPVDSEAGSSEACASCVYNPVADDGSPAKLDVDNTLTRPDNLVVMQDNRVVIGEDPGTRHSNAMVWVYAPPEESEETTTGGESA